MDTQRGKRYCWIIPEYGESCIAGNRAIRFFYKYLFIRFIWIRKAEKFLVEGEGLEEAIFKRKRKRKVRTKQGETGKQ